MSLANFDLNDLDFKNAGNWPLPIKIIAMLAIAAAVLFAGYWFDTKEQIATLERSEAKELELKKDFEKKQADAANLKEFRAQMEEMKLSFGTLLRQLPSKTEIAELLVDISRVGLDAGLEFELFKPDAEVKREFYAEFPINLRVVGNYHQLGNFVSGVAALPRIVTLHNLKIDVKKSGKKDGEGVDSLVMVTTANTYRYLEKEELAPPPKKPAAKNKKRK